MRRLKIVLIIVLAGWLHSVAFAQESILANSPVQLRMINADAPDLKTTTRYQFGHVVKGTENYYIDIKNASDKKYYYTLFDIQPDNIINLIMPSESFTEPAELVYRGLPHDSIIYTNLKIKFTPPYGTDKLLLVASETPDIGRFFLNHYGRSGISRTPGSKDEVFILQQLRWVLQGQPSELFKDCFFSVMDIVIIPTKETGKAGGTENNRATTTGLSSIQKLNARQVYTLIAGDRCVEKITDPENLYTVYPLLSFIQPLQAGATRGAIAEHEVRTRAFVLKGFATALKGVKQVLVNGETGNINALSPQQFSWEKEVSLKAGKNSFTVNVITPDGRENCEELVLNYVEATNEVVQESHNYSLFIGINKYKYFDTLTGARKDAADVSRLLQDSFRFDKKYSIALYDEMATMDNIDSVFRQLISVITPADNLVVYFAGHGVLDKQVKEGYWIPVEARKGKSKDYIANSEIKKYLEAINAKHIVIFADACFSGGFFKTSRGDNYIDKVEKLRSKWLFCSGREEEVADLLAGTENSPFAFYLMKFLKDAGSDGLTVSQLAQQLNPAVANNSSQTPIAGPVRETGDEGGEFVFRKVRYK